MNFPPNTHQSLVDPSITLFVRSYPNDYKWLEYSVQSMRKHLEAIDYAILCIPSHVPPPREEVCLFFDQIINSPNYLNIDGYVAQQLDKLEAWRDVNTDYILYSDSDVLFTGKITKDMLFHDGKPILRMTPYVELGDTVPWQTIVFNYLGIVSDYEFMRSQPILHRTQTVRDLHHAFPNLITKGLQETNRMFSEFNFLGAFAYAFEHPYHFTEEISSLPVKQYWSWSGLTKEEEKEIQMLLSSNRNGAGHGQQF